MNPVDIAVQKTGRRPMNKIGDSFASTANLAMVDKAIPLNITICHGIGVTKLPGQKEKLIAHAWIEDEKGFAYDTTWGLKLKAKDYKYDLKIRHMVRYKFREFILLWFQKKSVGPWDEKIKAVVEVKENAEVTIPNEAEEKNSQEIEHR